MQIKNTKVLEQYIIDAGNIEGEISINHAADTIKLNILIRAQDGEECKKLEKKIIDFLEKEIER